MTSTIRHRAFSAAALAAILVCTAALAQNHQNPPPGSIVPETALETLPHRQISNGIVSVKVFLPGFYRGTRFDRTGVVAHATYKGNDFGQPWFTSYSPYVRDFWPHDGEVTVSTVSAAMGPAEEFAPVGFDEAGPCREAAQETKCGRFLKIGVGILKRDSATYDYVHNYSVLAEGRRTDSATKTSVRMTQDLTDKATGYGYRYVKTVRLVAGKAQMVIEHVLTNTGKKTIESSVYCHNFLTLGGGNEHVTITAPFEIKADKPFAPDAATVDGRTIRYLRAVKEGESVTSPISGFGAPISDYDFVVQNTATGFGQRIRADQPLARINFWSIATNVSWEPYIAISLKPGETKRWTYTYDYLAQGDAK